MAATNLRVSLITKVGRQPTGVQRYATSLAERLRDRVRLRVEDLTPPTFFGRGYLTILALRVLTAGMGADVVHATEPIISPRRVDVITFHDFTPLKYPKVHIQSGFDAVLFYRTLWMADKASAILVDSREKVDEVARYTGIDDDRVRVLPLGVDTEMFRPLPLPRRSRHVLLVGDANPRKNHRRLIEAAGRLPEPPTVVRVGSHRYEGERRALFRTAERHGVRYVETGYVGDDRLCRLYNQATVLAMPSLDEGFGFPPLEAAACGTPSVVSDIPVFRETMDGHATFVDPLDVDAIAEGLREAMDGPGDGGRLRAHAARYSWDRHVEKLLRIYEEVDAGS